MDPAKLCSVPTKPTIFHIPVCPFLQRVEILLSLKGLRDEVQFEKVDITKPRAPELIALSRGNTALPMLVTEDGKIIHESLVIMRYIEDRFPEKAVLQRDPFRRAVENMFVAKEGAFVNAGYGFVLNQDLEKRPALHARMCEQYAALDAFLSQHQPDGDFLFESYGWAEFEPSFRSRPWPPRDKYGISASDVELGL